MKNKTLKYEKSEILTFEILSWVKNREVIFFTLVQPKVMKRRVIQVDQNRNRKIGLLSTKKGGKLTF